MPTPGESVRVQEIGDGGRGGGCRLSSSVTALLIVSAFHPYVCVSRRRRVAVRVLSRCCTLRIMVTLVSLVYLHGCASAVAHLSTLWPTQHLHAWGMPSAGCTRHAGARHCRCIVWWRDTPSDGMADGGRQEREQRTKSEEAVAALAGSGRDPCALSCRNGTPHRRHACGAHARPREHQCQSLCVASSTRLGPAFNCMHGDDTVLRREFGM